MTYDYHGYWDSQTGHLAPLYMSEGDASQHFNANYSLEYWVSLGADRQRLVMGLPLYGQSLTLPDTVHFAQSTSRYYAILQSDEFLFLISASAAMTTSRTLPA